MRIYAILWQIFALVPIKIKGYSNIIKKGAYIICPNHSSYMDIPCIYVVFKRYFIFTGKKEIGNWPLFNIFYTSGMNILVDRDDPKKSINSYKKMLNEIDRGNPLVIFPEGTISPLVPKLTEFKSGAFSLAIQKQIPILPVTFLTNWQRLPKKGFWNGKAGPGISEIFIHEPVLTKGLAKKDSGSLQLKVREIINRPLQQRFGCEL